MGWQITPLLFALLFCASSAQAGVFDGFKRLRNPCEDHLWGGPDNSEEGRVYFGRDNVFPQLGPGARRVYRGVDLSEEIVWGEVVKDREGKFIKMDQDRAALYCFELNPPEYRAGAHAALREGRPPAHGIYLPFKEDFYALRTHIRLDNGSFLPDFAMESFMTASTAPHWSDLVPVAYSVSKQKAIYASGAFSWHYVRCVGRY